ncbi:uncharacterized protein LOC143228486 [Tachypleus tridentatus]|uniref:uncharacterized protein LOC143228486 n=1 Tax=Tachypleus tridentatus TaxID=6853 RepID=UPI003FCFF1F5
MAGYDGNRYSMNLSVHLRRRSSDSKASFYMGFGRGIDSDLEELRTPSEHVDNVPLSLHHSTLQHRGPSQSCSKNLTEITSPLASDSMPSENNPLVTPKPISMHRSASFGTPGVQTDRRNAKPDLPSPVKFPIKGSEDPGLGNNTNFNPSSARLQTHPSVEIQHTPLSRNSSFFGSCSSLPTNNVILRKDGRPVTWQQETDALVKMLSAMYAKLLVVMGLCFPLAEVISHKIPTSYYEASVSRVSPNIIYL